jgi:hypothetical protein
MHPSHLDATLSASAINSFAFLSSAPSLVAAVANSPKPFMRSGASARSFANDLEMSLVISLYTFAMFYILFKVQQELPSTFIKQVALNNFRRGMEVSRQI